MAEVHQLPLIRCLENGVAHLFAVGEQTKTSVPFGGFHRGIRQSGMTALGADEMVVLGSHQWMPRDKAAHRVDPEQLLLEGHLVDARKVSEGETGPAQSEGAGTGAARFLNQLDQFVPVTDLFKGQVFHGGTGDDQAIQRTLGQGFIPAHIELVEMVLIPALVGVGVEANPNRFDLQHR